MDTLKKFFPIAFKMSKSTGGLVASIILHIVIATVGDLVCIGVSALMGFTVILLPLCIIPAVIAGVLPLYAMTGVVFSILDFCKVFDKKDTAVETTAEEVAEETPAE